MRNSSRNNNNGIYEHVMFFVGLIMLISELYKQYILTTQVYNGSYNVWYFPFQLCSIPMYLCLFMPLASASFQKRIQIFLMTFSLLGGIAAFIDTTGMHYPITILTWHSYIWHLLIIAIGIWSGIHWCQNYPQKTTTYKEFTQCLPIWFACLGIATILNLTLEKYGEINMFYISPTEPSYQKFVHELAMKIGIHGSNLCYLLAMLAGAGMIMKIWSIIKKMQFHRPV